MAAPSHRPVVSPDTPIVIKVTYDELTRRFKLPLKDLGAYTLPAKLRQILAIPPDANVVMERYSDSAGSYIYLDSENPSVYKQLYRAAKAKLKLRIKVTSSPAPPLPAVETSYQPPAEEQAHIAVETTAAAAETAARESRGAARASYLDTVLSDPVSVDKPVLPNFPYFPPGLDPPRYTQTCPKYAAWSRAPQQSEPANPWLNLDLIAGPPKAPPAPAFSIDCNNCGASIPNEHYHCSICDKGDYDLCGTCVAAGVLCPGTGHWLIKRTVKDGMVTVSTTETIAPRKVAPPQSEPEPERVPEPEPEKAEPEPCPTEPAVAKIGYRTCNACFEELKETALLTCSDCPDYDLCLSCLRDNKHGHHPGHQFSLIHDDIDLKTKRQMFPYLRPGGRQVHAAICDGCNMHIIGVRNKCLVCPDWDYCSGCVKEAGEKHPGHRFAPIYKPIPEVSDFPPVHFGVYCDGPLCQNSYSTHITGVRYKCTICNDTDFCASCEAHPSNVHNRTHPLIKFKTPVRHVSVNTFGEDARGLPLNPMGDSRPATKSTSTETVAPMNSNAATQVQPEKREPSVEEIKPVERTRVDLPTRLQAVYVKDTVIDGTIMAPNTVFTQTWTMRNTGTTAWPKGCSIRFVGGDTLFNIDTNHPTSVGTLVSSMGSDELTAEVAPSESADFTVTLKTPSRLGRAISYWRLKSPDGMAFGDNLWCDVQVAQPVLPIIQEPESATTEPAAETPESETSVTAEPETEEQSLTESQMIFPKLEKESPVASTHEALSAAEEDNLLQEDEHDIADDVESLTLDDDETEDGFMTDEEYDILDASDQEYAVEAQKSSQK